MKTAFAILEGRIAPVFDTAQRLHVTEVEAGRVVSEAQTTLKEEPPIERAQHLVDLSVGILVCGAISSPMREALITNGIQVFPFVAGALHDVIQVWLRGELGGDAYRMPGCRGMARHHRRGSDQGGGRGPGTGACRGGGRTAPMGRAGAESVNPHCLCPQCGHRENHQQGVPCTRKTCPTCGTAMARE